MSDHSATTLPSHAKFTLALDKTLENNGCPSVVKNVSCEFSYNYNFGTNEGTAHLLNIGGTAQNVVLHPLGISGEYAFMSDIAPTTITVHGQPVTLNRISLVLGTDGSRSAAIMFGEKGNCIEATNNWKQSASLKKAMSASH